VHGQCRAGAGLTFTCECETGYSGFLCQTDIDECASGPCFGGATCVDGEGAWTCQCPRKYVGTACETLVLACETNNGGCDPHSHCIETLDGAECGACFPGFTGSGNTTCVDINGTH
jgi:hypothetical protein